MGDDFETGRGSEFHASGATHIHNDGDSYGDNESIPVNRETAFSTSSALTLVDPG